jgi:hypothetical protein
VHHYYSIASQRYCLELPRFRLEFELREGRLISKDWAGYSLARAQQLADTLPGVTQCLVLEPDASLAQQHPWGGPTKLLVPAGAVTRTQEGAVARSARQRTRARSAHAPRWMSTRASGSCARAPSPGGCSWRLCTLRATRGCRRRAHA